LDELCQFLGAADIDITPYLGAEQIVSGTLVYALGAGKAVISTPYSYAQEVLAEGRGRIVPFEDCDAIAREVGWLLDHEVERQAIRKKAYWFTRNAVWGEVACRYLYVFHEVQQHPAVRRTEITARPTDPTSVLYTVPDLDLNHLQMLTDDVGILQHADFSVPDRQHGYCTDDNACALICAMQAYGLTQSTDLLGMASTYLSFLRHAYNHSTDRFRNFMPYLLSACDIYAAQSRLEGFGMLQVEANACGVPVIGIEAMAIEEAMVHAETALLAKIAQEIRIGEAVLGEDQGFPNSHQVVFPNLRTADYQASIHDIADYLLQLMRDASLRQQMGEAGRLRVVELYDYRIVAQQLLGILARRLGMS
jgi:glycosyltransferase involved in cell wall biosynthesis